MSKSLDTDQARHFVWPDQYPNCLQRLSADDTMYEDFPHQYRTCFLDSKAFSLNQWPDFDQKWHIYTIWRTIRKLLHFGDL